MGVMSVHRALQKKQLADARKDFKETVMKKVEDELSAKAVLNVKAVFLLALKKEGWGQKRAIRLWEEVKIIENALADGDITWQDVYDQVKEEYAKVLSTLATLRDSLPFSTEEEANRLLGLLIGAGVTVITFDLSEPSLHEIFVEKVVEQNEAE